MASRLGVLHGQDPAGTTTDPDSPVLAATIANTPASTSDDVFVLLTGFDDHRKIGPVLGWRTADPSAWPTEGQAATVVQVAQGNFWFVGWAATAAPNGKVIGEVFMHAAATVPALCLACDGGSHLRAGYPALFTALGGASSPYGLPDGTHFKVPDMRGSAPIGAGTGSGLTARSRGDHVGEETHTLTAAEMPAHEHNVNGLAHQFNAASGGALLGGGTRTAHDYQSPISGSKELIASAQGGGGAHNNMQPSTVVNFAIYAGA